MKLIDADALLNENRTGYPDVPFDALGEMVEWFTKIVDEQWFTKIVDEQPTVAASPWHRVEEPPKERDDYFAFTSDGEAKVCDYIPSVKQWWDGDYMILNVTHWMPIEPPKEGN